MEVGPTSLLDKTGALFEAFRAATEGPGGALATSLGAGQDEEAFEQVGAKPFGATGNTATPGGWFPSAGSSPFCAAVPLPPRSAPRRSPPNSPFRKYAPPLLPLDPLI